MNSEVINPQLKELDTDYLYHLGLDSSMDLEGMFGDVKYVCMGGSADRAKTFAAKAAQELGYSLTETDVHSIGEGSFSPSGLIKAARMRARKLMEAGGRNVTPLPIGKTERYSLYKVGPIISVNHGMGMPSLSILLHEMAKLLHYAGAKDFQFIRIGTSGGVGVEPGTVVVADRAINEELEPVHKKIVLGETREYPTELDTELTDKIMAARGDIKAVVGSTVGTQDFYEGQGRLDGFLDPGYTEDEKMAFLQRAHDESGVRNFEMEGPEFAAFCARAGIPAAIVCTTLLNRLEGDQVTSTPAQLKQFSDNSQSVVIKHIAVEEGIDRQDVALAA